MGSRVKEEERNERAVRALVKLPGNRRCVNCNSVGPQYVCTSFSTFICVNCSGIHREFTHRVKSISMAKFTSQEVSALQEGGNERAKEIYFKHYDFEGLPVPDSSDADRLRNFVKNVYVARRFMGERIGGDSPQVMGNRDDSYGNSSIDSSKGAIRSIHGETSEDNHGPHHSTERTSENQSNLNTYTMSGGMDQKNKSITGRENGSVRSYQRLDDVQKTSGGSEYNQKDVTTLVSSVPKPSKDTSGVVLPIKLPDPPRSRKATTSTANTTAQKTAVPMTDDPSSGSTGVGTLDFSKSLIDFDSDMEPRQGGVQTKMQNNTSLPSGYAGWTTFDVGTPKKATINSLVAPWIQVPNSVSAPQSGFPTVQTAKSLSFPQTNHGLQQHQQYLSPVDNIQTNYPPLNRANTGPVNVQSIFTMSYRPVYASAWDWQANSRINMRYGQYDMQYPAGAANFPSVASRAPSMGPVGSFLSPPQVPIALTANRNQYMIHQHEVNVPHQVHSNNFPIGYQGARGLATTARADGLYLVDQRMSAQNLQAMTQSSLPRVEGNPFT